MAHWLLLSLSLWKRSAAEQDTASSALTLRETLAVPGAKAAAAYFFCYCGLEQTLVLWGSSYLVLCGGFAEEDAAGLLLAMSFANLRLARKAED